MLSSKLLSITILSAALLLPGTQSGAGEPHDFFPDRQTRETLKHIYTTSYERNPSMLTWWDYETWSTIGVEGSFGKGRLHSPLTTDGTRGININTESILHQDKTGWTFSGKFEYGIELNDSLRYTLSHGKRPYGSPSMFFCIAPAQKWELQHYTLAATASKKLGTHWSAGVHLEYIGGKQFRKTDVRNEQSSLNIVLDAGATGVFGNNMLSAGLLYERNKEKPQFSRIYNSGPNYTIYLMNGLGTQITKLETSPSWSQNIPGAYLSWARRGGHNRVNIKYSFKYGVDSWKSEYTQSSTYQSKRTKYKFTSHGLDLTDILTLGCGGNMIFDGSFAFTAGNSSNWNNTASVFIEDYSALQFDAHAGILYSNPIKWFRKVGVNADVTGENRHDKNYDAKMDGINLYGDAFAGFGTKIGKADLSADIHGGISSWLTANYSPNAAKDGNNIYTTYIGRAEEAYMNADTWHAGAGLNIEFPAGKTLINIGASYSYTGTSADNTYKGTKWQSGKISLSVCF